MPTNPVAELRLLCPARRLPIWEARIVAERQAYRLHALMQLSEAPFPEQAIESLPRLEVNYVESRRLAGALQWAGHRWVVAINSGDTWGRQRFTLAHELKHLIDHPLEHAIYRDNRYGSARVQAERAADYFAACLLMPRAWLKRAFFGERIRDERVLAREFGVSTAAMRYRLDELKLHEPTEVAA